MYQPTFIEDGWRNDADHEYTDEATAIRFFGKDGFVVSMSVRDLGEGTMVTFVNHGNVDLRTLSQTTDAQPISESPDTFVYASPSAVQDVVDSARGELAALGWHEYTAPDATTPHSATADSQRLTFIQNGLELSASISIAPDHANKTKIRYGVTLLPLDLPVYDEALGVEFRRDPPYLDYKTSAGLDTLIGSAAQEWAHWAGQRFQVRLAQTHSKPPFSSKGRNYMPMIRKI